MHESSILLAMGVDSRCFVRYEPDNMDMLLSRSFFMSFYTKLARLLLRYFSLFLKIHEHSTFVGKLVKDCMNMNTTICVFKREAPLLVS